MQTPRVQHLIETYRTHENDSLETQPDFYLPLFRQAAEQRTSFSEKKEELAQFLSTLNTISCTKTFAIAIRILLDTRGKEKEPTQSELRCAAKIWSSFDPERRTHEHFDLAIYLARGLSEWERSAFIFYADVPVLELTELVDEIYDLLHPKQHESKHRLIAHFYKLPADRKSQELALLRQYPNLFLLSDKMYLVDCLWKIPEPQRQSLFALADPYLKLMRREVHAFMEGLLKMCPSHRQKVLELSVDLCRDLDDSKDIIKILKNVYYIPLEKIETVLEACKEVCLQFKYPEDRQNIIIVFGRCHPTDYAFIKNLLLNYKRERQFYTSSFPNLPLIPQFLSNLRIFPALEREEIMEELKTLFALGNHFLLDIFRTVPHSERKEFFKLLKPILDICEWNNSHLILEVAAKIPLIKLKKILLLIQPHLRDFKANLNTVIKLLAEAQPENRKLVIHYLMRYRKFAFNDKVDEIISYLIDHKQENVLTLMEYLCGGIPQNGYDQATVLNDLMFLPKSEIKPFIRIVYPLVRNFDHRFDHVRQQIISDFCRISPSDRRSVAKWLRKYQLLNPDYHNDARRIVRIPRSERKAIYELAAQLSSDPKEKLVFSMKIFEIPRSRRKGIIQSLGKRAKIVFGSQFIHQLHTHTDSELKRILSLTEATLVGDLQNISFISLFHAIRLLPEDIRSKVVEDSKPFLLATDSSNIHDLIKILHSYPEENKQEFLSQSLPIYKVIQQPCMRIRFLQWAAGIPFERFDGLGKLLHPIISKSPEDAPFLLFDGFSMLSQAKREKAIVLWHKHLNNLRFEAARKIVFALNRFPVEQWDQMILSLANVTNNGEFHDTLIDVFGGFPEEKRDEFIKRIQHIAAKFADWERSELYKELLLFPEEELSAILPLLTRLTSECSYSSLIRALPHIRHRTLDDREIVLQLLIKLTPSLHDGEEIDKLAASFCSLSGLQQRNIFANLDPLFPYISSAKQLLEILKQLNLLNNTEQQCFIEHFIELIHLLPNFTNSTTAAFASIPAAKRLDLIRELAPVLIRDEYPDSPGMILKHCAQLSLKEVVHILQFYKRLVACVKDMDAFAQPKIIVAITQLPAEDREKVITFIESHHLIVNSSSKTSDVIHSVYQNLRDGHEYILKEITQEFFFNIDKVLIEYTSFLAAIPEKAKRLEIYQHFSHFSQVSREILEEYLKIKRKERSQIHGYLLQFMSTFKCSDYNLAALLKVFKDIPREERPHVFEISCQLLNSSNEGNFAADLIRFIASLSQGERLEIVHLARELRVDWFSNYYITRYLRLLHILPTDRRQYIFEFACRYADSNHCDRIGLIKAANRYTKVELDEIENWLNPLLINLDSQKKVQMIIFISYFSTLERKWLIQFGEKLRGTGFMKSLCGFAHTMMFVPQKLRLKAIEFMALRPESDWNHMSSLFRTQDSIRIASHEYISAKLDKRINNAAKAYDFAKSIIDRADELMIHTEHPLYQRAVEVMCVSDPSGQLNPKNPYTLYRHLRKIHQNEELIRNQPDALRLDTVRLRAKAKQYTCADLPKDIPQQGFQLLFEEFEKRLNQLHPDVFNKTKSYIQNSFSADLASLRGSFLGSMLINNFLNIVGQSSDVIETPIFCLHAILKAVWGSSTELKENSLLTPREEMLLRVSASIKECPTGQRDGIVNYYNFLSIQYRTSEAVMRLPEARAAAVVDQAIQKAMNDVLSSKEFIKDLLGSKEDVALMPHQALYVRNRLCVQLGLIHRLSLDFHSGVIITDLLNVPLDKMIAVFFRHFTVASVVKQVKLDIRDGFKCKAVGYMDVMYLIESTIVSESGGNFELYFETDGDLTVTDKGAVAILRALQYL